MNEKEIWDYLYGRIKNPYAVAGLMGNLEAESNLEANRKQGDFTTGRSYSEKYTKAVDSGETAANSFIYDGVGYGLAQWTFWSRKQALLEHAKQCGKSVGDCEMQLDFLVKEFQSDYYGWWQLLLQATNILDASDIVLYHYEKPANASAQSGHRVLYAQEFYDKYAQTPQKPSEAERCLADVIGELGILYQELCKLCLNQ